jgi:hypothetical protein
MAKPRKKEPTLAELLAQYGRNIASDAPVVGRRIAEGVRSLPGMAAAGNRAMLGATQRIGDMLPPVLQMPATRGDYRPSFDDGVALARDIGVGSNRLVTGTSQRGLDAMGAPRGAGYDPVSSEMSRMAQDIIASGAQALPGQLYDSPLSTGYEAAMMMAPISATKVSRALEGAGALAGRGLNAMDLGRAPVAVNRLYNPSLMGPEFKVGDPNIPAYAYRKMSSPAELDDLIASGFLRPRPGSTNKYFQTSNDPMPAAGMIGSNQPYVRVETRNVPEGKAVRRKNVKIWDDATGSWKSVPKNTRR